MLVDANRNRPHCQQGFLQGFGSAHSRVVQGCPCLRCHRVLVKRYEDGCRGHVRCRDAIVQRAERARRGRQISGIQRLRLTGCCAAVCTSLELSLGSDRCETVNVHVFIGSERSMNGNMEKVYMTSPFCRVVSTRIDGKSKVCISTVDY